MADVLQLTPDPFRLKPDSPGFQAGADGKDLGANVNLVGPGAAYESWKLTPDYRQSLKQAGQGRERQQRCPTNNAPMTMKKSQSGR